MKRFVPCFLALLLLLTACSRPEGPAGNPSGDPDPTPAAQGHALPKENRSAAGSGDPIIVAAAGLEHATSRL